MSDVDRLLELPEVSNAVIIQFLIFNLNLLGDCEEIRHRVDLLARCLSLDASFNSTLFVSLYCNIFNCFATRLTDPSVVSSTNPPPVVLTKILIPLAQASRAMAVSFCGFVVIAR